MRLAYRINKATDISSKYVITIVFVRRHWLGEGASVVHYKYVACLDNTYIQSEGCWYNARAV